MFMRVIADLQIHSRYSRACSQDLTPKNIGAWADKKGIAVVGTGDFTHPAWLSELKNSLVETSPGLYSLKDGSSRARFLLSAEISSIYKQGDKIRRIHNVVWAPDFEAVDRIVMRLTKAGANLRSDGRPITGIHCPEFAKIILEANTRNVIVPAHAWTPHFGLFGSLSGFDSIEEAFGDQSKHIFAIETGLSSDPKMNWQISGLDNISLVSNSDAHSLRKIGREANAFEIPVEKLSFDEIIRIIKERNPKEFLFTIEFFPEEGKYHLDGHADCQFSCLPEETRKYQGVCPKCGKKLLVGVLNRVAQLSDRDYGFVPKNAVPFKSVIPLEELIAESFDTGVGKKVLDTYERMVAKYPEFEILLDLPEKELEKICDPIITQSILHVRKGEVTLEGGYDGVFGKIHIFSEKERKKLLKKPEQESLF
jgi:uncharacterized protein (TIGR00375 family)